MKLNLVKYESDLGGIGCGRLPVPLPSRLLPVLSLPSTFTSWCASAFRPCGEMVEAFVRDLFGRIFFRFF